MEYRSPPPSSSFPQTRFYAQKSTRNSGTQAQDVEPAPPSHVSRHRRRHRGIHRGASRSSLSVAVLLDGGTLTLWLLLLLLLHVLLTLCLWYTVWTVLLLLLRWWRRKLLLECSCC